MVGSSTPFHTRDGSAYSLFYGDEKVATGAVGVAVLDSAASASMTPLKLQYGSLAPVGDAHEVTRCVPSARRGKAPCSDLAENSSQGNIVLTLSGQNAARLLLNAVNDLFGTSAANLPAAQRTHEKEKEFYAAVYASKPDVSGAARAPSSLASPH